MWTIVTLFTTDLVIAENGARYFNEIRVCPAPIGVHNLVGEMGRVEVWGDGG